MYKIHAIHERWVNGNRTDAIADLVNVDADGVREFMSYLSQRDKATAMVIALSQPQNGIAALDVAEVMHQSTEKGVKFQGEQWAMPTLKELDTFKQGSVNAELAAVVRYVRRHNRHPEGPTLLFFRHLIQKEGL